MAEAEKEAPKTNAKGEAADDITGEAPAEVKVQSGRVLADGEKAPRGFTALTLLRKVSFHKAGTHTLEADRVEVRTGPNSGIYFEIGKPTLVTPEEAAYAKEALGDLSPFEWGK